MDQQQMATNPRLQRIRKVSRIFKYFFLLMFVIMTAFAASIWFLPIQENGVVSEVKFNKVDTQTQPGVWDTKYEVSGGTRTTKTGANASNAQAEPTQYTETTSISLRVGVQNDDHIAKAKAERPKPAFLWTVRPIGYVGALYHAVGFWIIYRLFHFFQMGLIFAAETVRCLKHIGLWLLGSWAWYNIVQVFDIFTQNPSFAEFNFDTYFAGGFLVLLISWLLDEGRKLQEEQSLTI